MELLLDLVARYGMAFVFACVLIEQAGLPVPAYPVLLVAGSLAAQGSLPFGGLLTAAVTAALVADALWYAAGKRFGNRVLAQLCRVSLSPDACLRQTRSLFERWGAPSLVVAKFIPGFATVATAMAGSTGVSARAFVAFSAIGAALWASLGLGLGWLFSPAVGDVLAVLQEMGRWGLLFLVAALAVLIAMKAWRRYQFLARLQVDRISVQALSEMLQRGESPLVVDVRSPRSGGERIPGAVFLKDEGSAESLRAPLDESLVVVYCACPNDLAAAMVARKLLARGFKRVRPLQGGFNAWKAAGFEVQVDARAAAVAA